MTVNNVYLIGMMGAGKTTIGKKLAEKMGISFVDSDNEIAAITNKTIAELFLQDGEQYFRTVESKVVQTNYSSLTVVATGGGVILAADNRYWLKNNGTVIYLKADARTLSERVKGKSAPLRPLLERGETSEIMQRLLFEREPLYETTAHVVVNTSKQSITETVTNLEIILEQKASYGSIVRTIRQ